MPAALHLSMIVIGPVLVAGVWHVVARLGG
jgi:hypothetical protein